MKFHPLNDMVVAKRHVQEATTTSGLHIPDAARQELSFATVLAVGPGRLLQNAYYAGREGNQGEYLRVPMTVSVGDTILLGRYTGEELKVGDDEVFVVTESKVLAIVTDSDIDELEQLFDDLRESA